MTDSERRNDVSNGTSRLLDDREIVEFFEKLKLGSSTDREKFLSLERLLNNIDSEQENPSEAFRVVFGDSTAQDLTSE